MRVPKLVSQRVVRGVSVIDTASRPRAGRTGARIPVGGSILISRHVHTGSGAHTVPHVSRYLGCSSRSVTLSTVVLLASRLRLSAIIPLYLFAFIVCTVHLNCTFTSSRRLQLKCVGTRAETRFRLSAKRMSLFKSAGASVQSTTGSRGVRISVSNAGYTMFRGSVKDIGYPFHSAVSPSLPLPCVTVFHHISCGLYQDFYVHVKCKR
jgi:hypothetical protein